MFMGEVLNTYNYQSVVVTDSVEALSMFKQQPDRFALIITDQTMPVLSGTELIACLRAVNPELPAILCSGHSDRVDAKQAEQQGISYFQKPVDLKRLVLKINELLKKE